jgi:formamidopyrimidine-DNA glycosylase
VSRVSCIACMSVQPTSCVSADFYSTQSAKLGPDPLREDADVEVVWNKLSSSRKSVGLILMDQTMVAGIGNIYRAEILFKVRL